LRLGRSKWQNRIGSDLTNRVHVSGPHRIAELALVALLREEVPQFINAERRSAQVKNHVAVGTHRPKLFDRVYLVVASAFRNWPKMVNVNHSIRNRPIHGRKTKTAHGAGRAVVFDASPSGNWIALLRVYADHS
jgi:hypothetical protein